MLSCKSRRDIQRLFAPGTLFAYWDVRERKSALAVILWWQATKEMPRTSASWEVKFIKYGGTIESLPWSYFNTATYVEIINDSTNCK